jgi:hypothetical protein
MPVLPAFASERVIDLETQHIYRTGLLLLYWMHLFLAIEIRTTVVTSDTRKARMMPARVLGFQGW